MIALAGFVLLQVGNDVHPGLAAMRHAAELNHNDAIVDNVVGTAHLFAGNLAVAEVHLERAKARNPKDPAAYFLLTALAFVHFLAGRFEQALAQATDSVGLSPNWDLTWIAVAVSAAQAGQCDRARDAVTQLERMLPDANLGQPLFHVFRNLDRRVKVLEGLQKAGLTAKR